MNILLSGAEERNVLSYTSHSLSYTSTTWCIGMGIMRVPEPKLNALLFASDILWILVIEDSHSYLLPHLSATVTCLYLWCWIQTEALNLASICWNQNRQVPTRFSISISQKFALIMKLYFRDFQKYMPNFSVSHSNNFVMDNYNWLSQKIFYIWLQFPQ